MEKAKKKKKSPTLFHELIRRLSVRVHEIRLKDSKGKVIETDEGICEGVNAK